MDYSAIEKAIDETKADIEKYLKKDDFKMMAEFKAWIFTDANQHKGGRVIFEAVGDRLQVEMNCNNALITVIMMNLLEKYGIEELIKLEAARRITGVSFGRMSKTFDTTEEMEVFKKMHNMSAEDIEKLKNEK